MTLNIAEGSGESSPNEKLRFYRIAQRSATECAATLDVLEAIRARHHEELEPGRVLLDRSIAMLTNMTKPKQISKADLSKKAAEARRG